MDTQPTHTIEPCPYCGMLASEANENQSNTKVSVIPATEIHPELYYVRCGNGECFACGPYESTVDEAVEAWSFVSRRPREQEAQIYQAIGIIANLEEANLLAAKRVGMELSADTPNALAEEILRLRAECDTLRTERVEMLGELYLTVEHEAAERQKEVGMQEYRGNTVSYIYDKLEGYQNQFAQIVSDTKIVVRREAIEECAKIVALAEREAMNEHRHETALKVAAIKNRIRALTPQKGTDNGNDA